MSDPFGPIQTIVEATGLPKEIWSSTAPIPPFSTLEQFKLGMSFKTSDTLDTLDTLDWISLHDYTISNLKRLSNAHVLGQGVLVRAATGLTVMVSIAEAAQATLSKEYPNLIWILTEVIQRQLRADAAGGGSFSFYLSAKKEESPLEALESYQHRAMDLEDYVQQRQRLRAGDFKSSGELNYRVLSELEGIRSQNEHLLRLVEKISQRDEKAKDVGDRATPITTNLYGDIASSTTTKITQTPSYQQLSFRIVVREKDGRYYLCVQKEGYRLGDDIRFVLEWLELALGGTDFSASSARFSGCLNLREENQTQASKALIRTDVTKESQTYDCWRKKILSGNILRLPQSRTNKSAATATAADEFSSQSHGFSVPTSFAGMSDCLLLSAAALWSLFENSLERVPHCGCTFRAAGGDFIQCKRLLDGGSWLLWHTFLNEPTCTGGNCHENQRIALTADDPGIRLFTTSPCVLGWTANSRVEPRNSLWTTLSVTSDFKKRELNIYKVKEFQLLAQLSVPVIVTPQLGGSTTFSIRNYQIASSVDHESVLAMERAAAAVVLIYDERRRLHLACDGADIIETLCMRYLKDLGRGSSSYPTFSHTTAMLRLQTWYHSNFMSLAGTYVTGDHLVREASKKVSELIELTKKASADGSLLYWLLEDVLNGEGSAKKAPRDLREASWHDLALKHPPLILAVGELDGHLFARDASPLKWQGSQKKLGRTVASLFNLTGIFNLYDAPGAIVGGRREMSRWLLKNESFSLAKTSDQICFGPDSSECTYEIVQKIPDESDQDNPFASCSDCARDHEGPEQRCLHYVQ